MARLTIQGCAVDFPYEPYSVQLDYMDKVIDSCRTRRHAILESPTGTGKTLSLLCSVLSWKRQSQEQAQVVYSSRTHSQLANVIKELKKTPFRPTVSHIAARSYLCLDDRVRKSDPSQQSRKCLDLRQHKKCPFGNDDSVTRLSEAFLESMFDLDEFVEKCRAEGVCPYMCAQANSSRSELILTPYTYIIDPRVRSNLPSGLFRNNVLIFDEAHNFPEQCCDYFTASASFHSFHELAQVLETINVPEIGDLVRGGVNIDLVVLAEAAPKVRVLDEVIERVSQSPEIARLRSEKYVRLNAEFVYKLFDEAEIDGSVVRGIIRLVQAIGENHSVLGIAGATLSAIEMVSHFIRNLFPGDKRDPVYIDRYYCVCITPDLIFHLLCFSPALAFRQIISLQPWTVIMTSGTIAPFQSFVDSLDVSFQIILENPHVADPSQLLVAIAAGNRTQFQFTYQNRENQEMKADFSGCFQSVLTTVPSGVLTFFASFSALDDMSKQLKPDNKSNKQIIVEPRDSRFMKNALRDFKAKAPDGAALFAVCRGKMSEGIDFSDEFARGVCVVGIPFPNISDFKVDLHRKWLESRSKGSGSRWYTEMAMRAVNQAIGRAIRHKNDYAVVILFDQRFEGFREMLSKWIRPSIMKPRRWPQIEAAVRDFFVTHRNFLSQTDNIPEIEVPVPPEEIIPKVTFGPLPPKRRAELDSYEAGFTRSQREILAPKTTKAEFASVELKIKVEKDERDKLCLVLRRFKRDRDISLLREGLESLESDECREIVLKLMNSELLRQITETEPDSIAGES
jgi:regulator of telomere elongation helicase 1